MATSSIAFEGVLSSTGSVDFNFTPPAHLWNTLCYGEVKLFQLSWGTTYTSPASHHTFILRESGWTQPQSVRCQTSGQSIANQPIATMNYGQAGRGLPFLFFMPSGPHTISFTVDRLNGTEIGTPNVIVVMDIVPANSRPTPLN